MMGWHGENDGGGVGREETFKRTVKAEVLMTRVTLTEVIVKAVT